TRAAAPGGAAAPAPQASVTISGNPIMERFLRRLYGAMACGARLWARGRRSVSPHGSSPLRCYP
ncbi:hypothetical protein, partial [Gemmatimonas sp.]|uniref:hypothetical protein n=1 Tax=Gemmatimonas sp. TaxID=1962908 RepID=UPI00391EF562